MKYNKRVQNYLSDENSKGRHFTLKNGKCLYLNRFIGQEKARRNDTKRPSKDLKEAFRDLLTQAYEMGIKDGEKSKEEELKDNLCFLRSLLK